MNGFKLLAFTHKTANLKSIGELHIDDTKQQTRLGHLKQALSISELLFLSTCNRVEFLFCCTQEINERFLGEFIQQAYPHFTAEEVRDLTNNCQLYEGEAALRHLLEVASSIDSLVIGEREIITQVRTAYEKSNAMKLTGDFLRLVIKRAIETAKQVYTDTQIAHRPVSIVSLAYRKLKDLNVKLDARFVIIGAGQTNQLMAKFLKKHGFTNFVVFNRTLSNAQKLAEELGGRALPLKEITEYQGGFDVILTCTASAEHIIDSNTYAALKSGEKGKKTIIDLSIPNDIAPEVIAENNPHYIDITALQTMASENMKERHKELEACHAIIEENISTFRSVLKERKVEIAMSLIPQKVKEIHETALNTVFAKDVEKMDTETREIVEKILSYVEKKYISVPMKMAKEILIEN
jgi:glutamyl-tRNA reductase